MKKRFIGVILMSLLGSFSFAHAVSIDDTSVGVDFWACAGPSGFGACDSIFGSNSHTITTYNNPSPPGVVLISISHNLVSSPGAECKSGGSWGPCGSDDISTEVGSWGLIWRGSGGSVSPTLGVGSYPILNLNELHGAEGTRCNYYDRCQVNWDRDYTQGGTLTVENSATVNLNIGLWLENKAEKLLSLFKTEKTYAQTSGVATTTPKTTAIIVANVNLTNTELLRTSDDKYTVLFTLANKGVSQQEEVMYTFSLKNEKGETVHTQRFDRSITLFKNKPVFISEEVIVPEGISGTYTVFVHALTRAGLPLGTGVAGTLTLKSNDVPHITSCSVNKKMYEQNQMLPVVCVVTANKPLANYQANGDGYLLATKAYYHNEQIEKASAKGELGSGVATAVLKGLSVPGRYFLHSQLMTRSGTPVGKEIITPFTVNGTSVSILNLLLDKSEYAKGDIAKGVFSGTVFTSENGKAFRLNASLTGKRGSCGENIQRDMNGRVAFELVFPIEKTCSNPTLTVKVTDEHGTVLAERTLAVQSDVTSFGKETKIGLGLLIIIIIALFVRPHLAVIAKKPERKKSSK